LKAKKVILYTILLDVGGSVHTIVLQIILKSSASIYNEPKSSIMIPFYAQQGLLLNYMLNLCFMSVCLFVTRRERT